MDELMACKIALLTECLITHITNIRALSPIHITGTPTFSTVYMELFIHSILARTENLNIRINAD
jgi:hypothetical protein